MALEAYARQALNTEGEQKAMRIRIRAERRVGEILCDKEMAKGGGDQRSDHRSTRPRGGPKTLDELGISYDQLSKWQKLADIPTERFEELLSSPHTLTK
jgi:hypothetical protein